MLDRPTGGRADGRDENNRPPHADGGIGSFGTSQKRTHSQKVGQQDVFHKDTFDQ
jgi:hypothetical protein